MEKDLDEKEYLGKSKECLERMIKVCKTKVDMSMNLDNARDNLKIDVAEVKNLRDKDGVADKKRVDSAMLKEAIEIVKNGKKSKILEKADTLEEYLNDIKNNNFNPDLIDTVVSKATVLEDVKQELSGISDSYGGQLDAGTIKALEKITKLVEKKYKEELKEKEESKSGKKPKKTTNKSSEIDMLVIELMQKLNVKLD